jgi:signal transduction histidine kinase
MKEKNTSIQQKLTRVILLTSAAALILTCLFYMTYEYISYREGTKGHLSTLGEITAANSTGALAFDDQENAEEVLGALKAERRLVQACIYDKGGHLFSKYPLSAPDNSFPATVSADGYNFTGAYLEGFQPIVQGNKRLGTLYLKSSLTAMYSRLGSYAVIALLVMALSFVLAFFLSRQLQKSVTRPILDLAATAEAISLKGDYTVRAVKSTGYEARVLTEAFNHMLDQIEKQNRQITSFNQQLEEKIRERTKELEEANEVLIQQNEFVETIINSSVDLISVLDRDLNFIAVNRHTSSINTDGPIIGKNIRDVFTHGDTNGLLNDLQRVLNGETVHNPNYKSLLLNRSFENFYIPLKDKDDKVYRILIIAHDVTTIIRANEKLQEVNRELEKSNQSLEQFAYVASHDLQEPLRKIQTFSELSEKNLNNIDIVKRYLQKITSSAHRMSDLVKAILNYSRISRTDVSFEKIDLNEVLASVRTDLELVISEKNAVIRSAPLPTIKGIPLQISQLFFNLVSNSLKFSEKTPLITIDATKKAGGVELSFRDNGIGFEQQYEGKIFTIFQRLHNSNDYAGTGIGLALCKRIVENHRGRIAVASEPGEGTTFTIYLPFG